MPASKAAEQENWGALDILAVCALRDQELRNPRRMATLRVARSALANLGAEALPAFDALDQQRDLLKTVDAAQEKAKKGQPAPAANSVLEDGAQKAEQGGKSKTRRI